MGSVKRKRTSSPESPVLGKKLTIEEAESHLSGEKAAVETAENPDRNVKEDSQVQGELRDGKQSLTQQSNPMKTVHTSQEGAVVPSNFEQDVEKLHIGDPASFVENLSQGQRITISGQHFLDSAAPIVTPSGESGTRSPWIAHLVPSHAGWFQWAKVHLLERLALPEYFSGKSSQKTPDIFLVQRNSIIRKYRENPREFLKFEDVQGSLKGDISGGQRLFAFLDHWGLINYQSTSDFTPFLPSHGVLSGLEETTAGSLQLSPSLRPALSNLFRFETALAPVPKLLSPDPSSNVPLSNLAEAAVQESLAAPSVEYHCNSCQADCSKRRYHCQKQADFDLCPDCYCDGKFGQGMTSTDFLRMDALTETTDANGGGWSDQETLLLLEALELYGDNWTEIAEHVATKSKSQCILHFIRLPIEDPFLEDMEVPKAVTEIQPPPTDRSAADVTSPTSLHGVYTEAFRDGNFVVEALESQQSPKRNALNQEGGKDGTVTSQTVDQSMPPAADNKDLTEEPQKELNQAKSNNGSDGSNSKHLFLVAAESAGCAGPDGLIAFADAGNPVMTQVAFLAAMVGPRVAAAAAQAALKSLAEEDPVGFLSSKNSFPLESAPRNDEILGVDHRERLTTGGQDRVDQSSLVVDEPVYSKEGVLLGEDWKSESHGKCSTGSTPGDERGVQGAQQPATTVPPEAADAQLKAPSLVKVRNAAASALASAAVKAKLLADQEEREIQRLVAGVIENQLKKLELKLKHFNELEALLSKECEQVEKARAKVYAERARIFSSRLGSPPNASHLDLASPTALSQSRTAHLANLASQSKPGVFTFGPSGLSSSAPAAKPCSGPDTNVSVSADVHVSTHQGGSQSISDQVIGNSLVLNVKSQQ